MQKIDPGKASVTPRRPLVAGSNSTVTFTYVAGHPIDDTGFVKIAFRYAGDFGAPQFTDPAAPNYCTLRTDADCRLVPRWDEKGNTRPWVRTLYIQIRSGFLARGQQIVVVFGDRSGGSPGWQVQSFRETTFEFKTFADPIATYEFKELPVSPTLRVIADRPARAVCIAPSVLEVGRPFTYHLKLEDRWGNPTARPLRRKHKGFNQPGIHSVEAADAATGLRAESNPVEAVAALPVRHPWWADLHGQSEETIGTNSITDYYVFARDYALLDAAAHQGNDFQVTDAFWEAINRTARRFYHPGRFVTFPGYEWSGNTPLGGDRNVYYASEGGRITRSCCDLLPGKTARDADSPTAAELFRNLKGPGPFAYAHVGGRYPDLSMHDPKIEAAVEIHSAWGTFEWLAEDAFARGYRVGIVANSDDHKCRPGASYPGAGLFGSYGGLTCILSERLDRESVREAIMARRTYATTGNRPFLHLSVALPNGREAAMGEVVKVKGGVPVLRVRYTGTAPVESIEVRNGAKALKAWRPFADEDLGARVKVIWSGAEVRGRGRMVRWDGSLRVTGNSIADVLPVNFLNPARRVERMGDGSLKWLSVTTGGLAGVIVTLAKPQVGTLDVQTEQGGMRVDIRHIGLEPRRREMGGLRKQIEIFRLPEPSAARRSVEFELPLKGLKSGDNPIYVRLLQEDGHMTWSSPVYLVSAAGRHTTTRRNRKR